MKNEISNFQNLTKQRLIFFFHSHRNLSHLRLKNTPYILFCRYWYNVCAGMVNCFFFKIVLPSFLLKVVPNRPTFHTNRNMNKMSSSTFVQNFSSKLFLPSSIIKWSNLDQ